MFFSKTMSITLFSVLDKLIIVIRISIFSFFNLLLFCLCIQLSWFHRRNFSETRSFYDFFHWIVSFSFVVCNLIFWFMIFVMILLTIFAQINDDDEDVEFVWSFVRDLSEAEFFLAVCMFFDVWDVFFAFDCVFDLIETDFFDDSRFDRDFDWINFFLNCSIINFVIFCFNVFSHCWKFSNIVSQYDDFLFEFFVKSINANSKFFFVCIWSMKTDASLIKSRFALARSIWLISYCMITCSIFGILRSSYKVFCAFFRVSFTDNTNVEILIESNFFLRAIWRCFFALLLRLINASSFWLEINKSIMFVSLSKIFCFLWFSFSFSFEQALFMLCSICWLIWFWFRWFAFNWSEFDWFEIDWSELVWSEFEWSVIIWFELRWFELNTSCWNILDSLFILINFFSISLLISSNSLLRSVLSNVITSK